MLGEVKKGCGCCACGSCHCFWLVRGTPKEVVVLAISIIHKDLLEKQGLLGGGYLLYTRPVRVGRRRALLTATSANSSGKPKGTLRQPRSLSMPEEGGKKPVPRVPRGRGVACGVVKPTMESARSALPPAAGGGPSREIPMQRHVTVVNRSVCVCVCVRERCSEAWWILGCCHVPSVLCDVGIRARGL